MGHDHLNNYCAIVNGINLGYAGYTGYTGYGNYDIARGARIFMINESDPTNFETWIRQEGDKELNF